MICRNCNISIPEGAAFCPLCGAEITADTIKKSKGKKCLQCGADNPLEARFCRVDGWMFPAVEIETKSVYEQENERERQCPTCGTINPATARFCRKDGSPLETDHTVPGPIPEEGVSEDTMIEPNAEAPKIEGSGYRSQRRWIYLAAALIVLFGAAATYWFVFRTASDKKLRPGPESTVEAPRSEAPPRGNEPSSSDINPQPEKGLETKSPEVPKDQHKQDIDLPQLEGQINKTLRAEGLQGVTAQVDDAAAVTLRGVVIDPRDQQKALKIAKSFKGIRQVKDIIFVIER